MLSQRVSWFSTPDGWRLKLARHANEYRIDRAKPPLLFVSGYCMNDHALITHPSRESFVEFLTQRGFEVWTVHLRGQGESLPRGSDAGRVGLYEMSCLDLRSVIAYIDQKSECAAGIVALGCSLGASLLYIYLAHHNDNHGLRSMVSLGGPLHWVRIHPMVKVAFASERVVSAVAIRGTRSAMRLALPVLKNTPKLLSLYMNANHVSLSNPSELVKSVDDPHPELNRDLARWFKSGSLSVGGLDIGRNLEGLELPLLAVAANRDGIVPPETVASGAEVLSYRSEFMCVGDSERWFAHADLFVNHDAPERVFRRWRTGSRVLASAVEVFRETRYTDARLRRCRATMVRRINIIKNGHCS